LLDHKTRKQVAAYALYNATSKKKEVLIDKPSRGNTECYWGMSYISERLLNGSHYLTDNMGIF